VTALAEDCTCAGHPEVAEAIDHAIAGGATGTEILHRLHVALGELVRSRAIRDRRLKRRARSIRRAIARQLRVI